MMNDTSVLVQHSSNFQFLSVCHYITTLGIIFYNKGLITLNQRHQTVSVLNNYFKYLNNSNNKIETKLQLLQIILKGTDLYGGGENETLDTKYVDETYQYIINSALFSHYGNINGYLAKIINKADNTSYSTLMKTIKQEFFNNYTIIDYCSKTNKSPKLNFLSAKTIFFEYILPIFPEPENKDMNIMEVDYLYAMAGLKIVKSILGETLNASFGDLISISREFDLQEAYGNETYEIMLNVFSTPALFFYASKKKETFREKYQISSNIEFWTEAYKILFSYINARLNNFVHQFFDNILLYKLEKEMRELKNRRLLATTILEKYCTYSHFKNHSSEFVTNYMSYSHIFVKLFLPSGCFLENLPELQVVYENQFKNVQKTYNEIEKIRIKKFIIENNFEEKLNSNVTVMSARVLYDPFRTYNGPLIKKQINNDIYLLFSIQKENNMTEFFAIKEEKKNLTLLTNSGKEQNFSKAVTNLFTFPIDSGEYSTILKKANENSEAFAERIAEIKTTQFVNNLMEDYKNETTKEKVFNFVKVLVPFYNCIENIIAKNAEDAVISCSLDVLTLMPVTGLAAKYSTKITTSLATRLSEKYVISTTLSSATKFNSLCQIAKLITKTVSQEILTKSLLKDLSITFLRVIDPGFELISSLGKFGYQKLHKIYNTMIQKIPKINTSLKLLLTTLLKKLNTNMKLSTFNGLIPKVVREENNYKLVQYYYPNGENFFGPKCISSFGNTAELRTIEGNLFQVPVLPVKDNMNKISYREYNPSTNEISNIKLEMEENDLLRSNLPYLEETKIIPYKFNPKTQLKGGLSTDDIPSTSKESSQLFSTDTLPNVDITVMDRKVLIRRLISFFNLHKDTKIINDVQIYHNTIEWNKTPMNINHNLNGNVNFPSNINLHNSPQGVTNENIPINLPESSSNIPRTPMESEQSVNGGLPTDDIASTSKGSSQFNFQVSVTSTDFSDVNTKIAVNFHSNTNQLDKTPIKKKKSNADEHLNPDLSLIKNINSDSSLETMKNPPSGEINSKENFSARRTGILMDSVQPLTKEILPQIPLNHYIDELGEENYNLYVESLKKFKKQGLQLIKEDKFTMQSVRLLLNYLSQFQNIDTTLNEVKKLYFHQTITYSIIIDNYLSKLKGSNFYFNDITLLNDIKPNNIINKKLSLTNTEIEVLYCVNFHSKNGFINLAEFHDSFKNDYIVFPEISFNVHSVKFLNKNRLLILDLNQKSMPISDWMAIRERDLILLDIEEIESTKIIKCIENAALSISSKFLLQRFRDMKIIFKKFILNTDQYTSNVPTYDELAKDYYVNFKIPKNYKQFEIFNGPFIDDVLFYDKLHKINSLESAKQIINQLFSGVYLQNVEFVFKMYQSVSLIENQIRFEDYYVIYSYFSNTLSIDVNGQKRLAISLYRLALRQSMNEMLINKPITLYTVFVVNKLNGHVPILKKMIGCYSNREKVIKDFPLIKPWEKIILCEFEMFNEAGIANIGRVFPFEKEFYIIPQEVQFMKIRKHTETINGMLITIYKFSKINFIQEKLIAKLAVKLNTLLSSNVKFYVNDI
ncbi:uncharacterized protein LOC127290130 [Leptopilina boulardi]|uniref:uncharacterized protein LOC127290130 n=1 Tax=Leptopilina boulardi TaxID=63433 RepID=UPI0021F65131|nr:uncharacterized protein LOC127290130 [Leptopilina boulardi]